MRNCSIRLTLLAACLFAALALGAMRPANAQRSYETVSFGEKFGYYPFLPNAIADNGTILAENILFRNGSMQELPQLPGTGWTVYTGVNASLTTTGYAYTEDFSDLVAFVRKANGQVTWITVPGGLYPAPSSINDQGDVVGTYTDEDSNSHGFVADQQGVRAIDVPGALYTNPTGINASGVVVGYYFDSNGNIHSFVLDRSGFHDLDIPGAVWDYALCINNHGEIGGAYNDGTAGHGFVYDRGRVTNVDYTIPDLPDSFTIDFGDPFGEVTFVHNPASDFTGIFGLSNRGEVVGAAQALYFPVEPFPIIFAYIDSFWGEAVP